MNTSFKFGKFTVGLNSTFIIAELSANHAGSLDNALRTVEAAKKAGANCIKLQTYTADTLTLDTDKDDFLIKGTIWDKRRMYDLYHEAHTPWSWHKKIFQLGEQLGLEVFSTPFDRTAVDFLEDLGVDAYKIASFEIGDIPLLNNVIEKNKPIIVSTGIAYRHEISKVVDICREKGNYNLALLKCTSNYPSLPSEANLANICTLRKDFDTIVGLSDHSLTNNISIAAVALGAKIVEKHLILDRSLGGPDCKFSLNPNEFTNLVNDIRMTESIIGSDSYELCESAKISRDHRKSIYFAKKVKKGDRLTIDNIKVVRPGFGLSPDQYDDVLGKFANGDYDCGDRLTKDSFY